MAATFHLALPLVEFAPDGRAFYFFEKAFLKMTPTSCVYVISDKTGAAIFVGKATGAESISALASLGALLPVTVREGLTEAEAFEIEKGLIQFHGRADLGTGTLLNFSGPGTPNPSAESRAKSSAAKRRRAAIATAKHGAF